MNWLGRPKHVVRALVIPIALLLIVSCGGGGGGGGSGVSATPTGSVSVLVTDLPTDDYCEINVTITRVVLIGQDGQITLYSNPAGKTFDLLDLRGHSEVFSHTTGVPAGTYSKIRLVLAGDVELKPVSSCNDPAGWFEAEVPSGKLDLNPQGEFTVPANGALIVELDMDAKAFKLTQTGNGRWKVRPVVFVNVLTEDGLGKLVRVSGRVENKVDQPDLRSFELCRTDIAWDKDDNDDLSVQPLSDHDDGYRRCVTVVVLDDTSFFDDLGDPATYDAVTDGAFVTVIGRLAVSEMNDGDDPDKLVLNAEVIEVGEPGVYEQWTGIVRSVPADVEGDFDFEFEPPQGFLQGTIVPVDLQPGTKLYSRMGDAIGIEDFAIGLSARVEGVFVVGADDFIKSSVVWLDLDADQDSFEGLVDTDSVDVDRRSFTLMSTSSSISTGCSIPTDRVVYVLPDAVILLVTEDAGSISNERLTLEEMAALGAVYEAEVYGTEDFDCTITSDRIVLQADDNTL